MKIISYSVIVPPAVEYQAEDATIYHSVVQSERTGYTGTGYVNYKNEIGSYIEWVVGAAQSGVQNLTFRYANGKSADRPMEIIVDGTVVDSSLSFLPTGTWTTWEVSITSANLTSGVNNIIRATGVTSDSGPNVDKLDVSN